MDAYGTWGRDVEDASAFLLESGPGRHLTGQVGPEVRDRAPQRLRGILRAHEGDGPLRLRSAAWLVTAARPERRA